MLRITKKVDRFARIIAAAPQAARELEREHTETWADVMIQIMPEDTGEMKRSTEVVETGSGRTAIKIGVYYWRFVNDGTIYQEGQFFVEESREFIRKDFLKDLKQFTRRLKV